MPAEKRYYKIPIPLIEEQKRMHLYGIYISPRSEKLKFWKVPSGAPIQNSKITCWHIVQKVAVS
jgi:hypothetical protein